MSMTLRELVVCASPLIGSYTIREHMSATNCLTMGGDITINGEFVGLKEEPSIMLSDTKSDIILNDTESVAIIEKNEENIKIEDEENLNGIC